MWKVSSPTILGVTQRGYVTGLKAGSAYVYATYKGRTYKCKVTVKADLSKVFLNKKSITMNEGDLYNLVLFNASGATYRSSNPSVASVTKNSDSANSSSCTVNAKKAGTATITVKYAGNSFTCRVTVNKKTKPEINIDSAELNVGETLNLKLQNASGSIIWRTSNYRVAKVSSTGKVTGVAAGKATITAQNNGKKYTCTVTVKNTVKSSEMKIPLYIQSDYSKVKYGNSNLAVCGDGPTCLAMIASYKTGKTVTPAEIVKWCGNKYYINGSGTSYNIFSAAKKYGIKSVTKTSSTSMVLKALQEGKPVVSVQKRGLFTNNGTFIVLRGIDKGGKILVNYKEIGKDVDFPEDIGVIIETPGFLPNLTGMKNLEILASLQHKIGKERIQEVLQTVGLDPKLKKPVSKYSLGMRQRLGIAQAVMEDPSILILDEPFNGLDKKGVKQMHELILSLKGERKTILLSSHSQNDIDVLCDTVCEMDAGTMTCIRERAGERDG